VPRFSYDHDSAGCETSVSCAFEAFLGFDFCDASGADSCVGLLWGDHADDAQRIFGFAFLVLTSREDHDC